jgi:hypothetical protein
MEPRDPRTDDDSRSRRIRRRAGWPVPGSGSLDEDGLDALLLEDPLRLGQLLRWTTPSAGRSASGRDGTMTLTTPSSASNFGESPAARVPAWPAPPTAMRGGPRRSFISPEIRLTAAPAFVTMLLGIFAAGAEGHLGMRDYGPEPGTPRSCGPHKGCPASPEVTFPTRPRCRGRRRWRCRNRSTADGQEYKIMADLTATPQVGHSPNTNTSNCVEGSTASTTSAGETRIADRRLPSRSSTGRITS